MQKIKSYWHEFKLWWRKDRLIHSLYFVIGALILFLFIVGFETCGNKEITWFLGTEGGEDPKKETIKFIAFGVGGVLAVMAAVAANRRATAQIENAAAQVENNKLVEKGHRDQRFNSATENLGSENPMVRISAFYQFYYLAKDHLTKDQQDNNFRQSIFEILCSCSRSMPRKKSHSTEEDGKEYPTTECQTLLNILFHPKYCAVFNGKGFEPNLQRAHLVNTHLFYAKLSNALLSNANLSGARLLEANISDAKLQSTNLSDAQLILANLSKADLSKANLSNAWLLEADLSNAKLSNANLSDAWLSEANLSNANLSKAKLSNANLSDANFSDVDLTDANLSDANLLNANLSNANLSGANLSNVDLSDANLSDADLSGADLSDAALSNTNLSNAKLSDARFSSKSLLSFYFLHPNFSSTNFTGANLSGTNFQRMQLKEAKLQDVCSIERADFRWATIGNRPITKADLPTDKGEYYADWNPPPDEQDN